MKKLFFLLTLSILFMGACSGEDTPDGGNGGDSGGISNTTVKDSNGQNLGSLISESATGIGLISPKGYYYSITYEGYIGSVFVAYTDNETTINKNNLYISSTYPTLLVKKSAYLVRSTTGGIPEGEIFCHEDSYSQLLEEENSYYWQSRDYVLGDLQYVTHSPAGAYGIKIQSCPSSQTGIPDNITPPLLFR